MKPAYLLAGVAALALVAGSAFADPAANKKTAEAFDEGLIAKRDPESVRKLVTADFKDHNGQVEALGGDFEAAKKFVARMPPPNPNAPPNPAIMVIAEGDYVSELHHFNMGGRPGYLFDVYHFTKDGKIDEHWDSIPGPMPGAAGGAPAGGPPASAP